MDIWEKALGFMDAQILLTAEEIGVFNCLAADGGSAAKVASETGIPKDSAERLLSALCAMGIVNRLADGTYVNGPEAAEQLVRGRPEYIGAMFHHLREDLYPAWRHFREALSGGKSRRHGASGQSAPTEEMFTNPEALRSFMEGMHAITYEAASEFAWNAPELHNVENIVDLGGASGAFLIAVAQKFRDLHGLVFDLPPVRPIAEDFIKQYDLSDRLGFYAGDFWSDPIPAGADAYSLGFILHDWDTRGGSHLLKKISDAVEPGGLLIIAEYLLDDDRTGPMHVARSDLNMLVAARGRERTAREYSEWIGEFGFKLQRIQPTSKGKNFLLARSSR